MDKDTFVGEVAWFNSKKEGYGFITWSKDNIPQKDIFLHWSDISKESCPGYKIVYKGQKVQFNIGTNAYGDPKAINVVILKD